MPRAMATFRHAGIPVTAATADVHAVDSSRSSPFSWLPNAGALVLTTNAMREWLGWVVYRARGYL
jgi:uncharacterized SAM-binding protein YcdF (DUF218 family)